MRIAKFGELEVRLAGGDDGSGGGDGAVVILLHGFGAPGNDLASLWKMLRVPADTRFAFPAAPLELPGSIAGNISGRAWWMLDIERFAIDAASGRAPDLNIVPDGLPAAREKILAMLTALDREWGLPAGRVFLGGFSQGAMLACDVVARTKRNFAGLIILSGAIIAKQEWNAGFAMRAGLPVFQSHGANDPLLGINVATQLRDMLRGHGLIVNWRGFDGGHEINAGVLEGMGEFIARAG